MKSAQETGKEKLLEQKDKHKLSRTGIRKMLLMTTRTRRGRKEIKTTKPETNVRRRRRMTRQKWKDTNNKEEGYKLKKKCQLLF